MCGIAGHFGPLGLEESRVCDTLEKMSVRGPDYSSFVVLQARKNKATLLHSRLSILDLESRSNQPFEREGCSLIFNGEIYNYVEIRNTLIAKGHKFDTESDTEVLLRSYLEYGKECVEYFEGMWAFAIYDCRTQQLFLSRDRFAEKPLYFMRDGNAIFFGSEIKYIAAMRGCWPSVNHRQVLRYLVNGYRSLYMRPETFFENVYELPYASWAEVTDTGEVKISKYWKPRVQIQEMSLEEAIEGVREKLIESIKIRLRSDVPIGFCLSGGVDSGAIVSIAAKKFGCEVSCYSIIDSDERYNEIANISATAQDIGCRSTLVELKKERTFDRLEKLIAYHDSPIATISYYIHSFLSRTMAQDGCKVVFSGTASDELFTGYFDHYAFHLLEMQGDPSMPQLLSDWNTHVKPIIRNPVLQNPNVFVENPSRRDHIFLNNDEFSSYLKTPFNEPFREESYSDLPLRNRMLNEIFHEATRVILHEDDLNSMFYSMENRSPFLDKKLFEFAYSIPSRHLIRNGYGKYVLRQSLTGILNDQVRLDRQKRGFNASIYSIFDFRQSEFLEVLLDDSPIYDLLDRGKVEAILSKNDSSNSFSKYLFNFINSKIFLEQHR